MDQEGHVHDGTWIAWEDRPLFLIDTMKITGKQMMAFGQTAITQELYRLRMRDGGQVINEAESVELHDVNGEKPYVSFKHDGVEQLLHGKESQAAMVSTAYPDAAFLPRSKEPWSARTRSVGSASCRKRRRSTKSCMLIRAVVLRWLHSAIAR
jgi:hypothetical protein